MTDFFPPTLDELITCVQREIGYRARVYPRRVANKQMTQRAADREIEMMRAILGRLQDERNGWKRQPEESDAVDRR